MNKTKSKTASAASLNVPDDAEMRVTWQNRRWEKDFSTTVFQVLCFHPSWVVESISWTRSWPSQKIVHFRSREMFGSVHTSYGSGIFHAFVLGLIHKELQDPGQSPWITADIWWKNPGLFCKVKWRVKRFTKIHKDLEQIIEKSSSLVCRFFFQHSHCLLLFHMSSVNLRCTKVKQQEIWMIKLKPILGPVVLGSGEHRWLPPVSFNQ